MRNNPSICVVGGAGHVGFPLSLAFTSVGQSVLIYDINQKTLEKIKQGIVPFLEEGAETLLKNALSKKLLYLTSEPKKIAGVKNVIITIGTPVDEFHNPTLKLIRECIDELIPVLSNNQLLILRSTVYPGVTNWLSNYLHGNDINSDIAFCPERVVQGYGIEEIKSLPQIVSGITKDAEDKAVELFEMIAPSIVRLSPMEAELAKLFSNAYRYIQFAAANQFYNIATEAGVDYHRLLNGMKTDYPRLKDLPGPGFAAGPCLHKDTMQLSSFYQNKFSVGQSAMLVNEGLPLFLVEQLERKYNLPELTVGLLGMSFKARSDDPRSSLSYKLKKVLNYRSMKVLTTDPYVKTDPDLLSLEEVLSKSDILILCTPHPEYKLIHIEGKEIVDVWGYIS
jgi:UDP-N-acetyl-D-mannosaminuronic acid dehydrogenase